MSVSEEMKPAKPYRLNLDSSPDTRTFDKAKIDNVTLGGVSFARMTMEPGWKWSKSIKPVAKTESCQLHHVGYVISGKLKIRMNNGNELKLQPGDAYEISPGHDAEVIGDKPYVALELRSAADLAKMGK